MSDLKHHQRVNVWLQVFVSDSRINVYIDVDTWVLVLYKVVPADEALYKCYVNQGDIYKGESKEDN